jgi:hypothetical protein
MKVPFQATTYHICVRGQIPENWQDAFADFHLDFCRDECGILTNIKG